MKSDTVELAAQLIAVDSSHNGEGGNTRPIVEVLERFWSGRARSIERFPTPREGNDHLVVHVGPPSSRRLLFLCHTDVVPANSWSRHQPYVPTVEDDFLYGRGALDMKGMVAAVTTGVATAASEQRCPDTEIVIVYDCDEEGGWNGTPWLTERRPDLLDVDCVITEGGWSLTQEDGVTPMVASMSVGEKTFGAVRLKARGTATHSSRPTADSAIAALAAAIDELGHLRFPATLTPTTRAFVEALADATHVPPLREAAKAVLDGELDAVDTLCSRSDYPALLNAMMRPTQSLVIVSGGTRANVLPAEASVLVQLRFLPGGPSPRQCVDLVRNHLSGRVSVELVGPPWESESETMQRWTQEWSRPLSPMTPAFTAWQSAVGRVAPEASVSQCLFEGGTSAKPWATAGVPAHGIYPYFVDNRTLTSMHGDDERVRVSELLRAHQLIVELVSCLDWR